VDAARYAQIFVIRAHVSAAGHTPRDDGSRIERFDQVSAQNAPRVSGRFGATLR
jgi:hypothetical protein